jgi:NADH-quinone oxidoreductase subunit G
MQAVIKLATANNAVVSGYSEGYIKTGDGDLFLIQDDKSANRAAFGLLGLDSSKAGFESALVEADLVISFQNDLCRSLDDADIAKIQDKAKIVYIGSYKEGLGEIAAITLPVAAYSEDTGIIINADNILQQYDVAVRKNDPAIDLLQIVTLLGGEFKNREEVLTDLSATIAALNNIDLKLIPSEGIALTDKEVSNVAA